jgi:hypothetical protein
MHEKIRETIGVKARVISHHMTHIWKMPLSSQRDDFQDEPPKVHRAREFCFKNGWTGIGWGIDSVPDGIDQPHRYESALFDLPEDRRAAARSAHHALAHKMQPGDFVWCRAQGNIYWLGRVSGSWLYRNVEAFDDLDLYQIRKCQWVCVGPADLVPGPIKNAFAGPGSTISRINREHDAVLRESASIWEEKTDELVENLPPRSRVPTSPCPHYTPGGGLPIRLTP